MASLPAAASSRRRRLAALAEEWQVGLLPPPTPIVRPLKPKSIRTQNDDLAAEELLKRQRLAATADGRPRSPTLTRAFTNSRRRDKVWDSQEVFSALNAHVDKRGSPGVAEALIAKLVSVGGDVNVARTKTKTNLLTRRRSVESFERSRLLQQAIQNGDAKLVAVLVPHADPVTLDASLPDAIRTGRAEIVEHLVRYGANVSATSSGRDAFRKACAAGDQEDIVGILLTSDGRPAPDTVSPALVDAVERGCTETVRHLCRASADGSFDNASALKKAVAASRVDLALAIVNGSNPPSAPLINEAFEALFAHETIHPNEKMALAEVLLCAGATGDVVASAVNQACISNFSEMVSMLISYGAPVDYDNAIAVRRALSHKQFDIARILLAEGTTLDPEQASECLALLPRQIANDDRFAVLELLLRKGAGGAVLNECLVDAVEAGDIGSTQLLLTPYFASLSRRTTRNSFGGRASLERHDMASVEYKDGMALQLAVQTVNYTIVELILALRPPPVTLAVAFPNISLLPPELQYHMYELFLATGFSGPCVNAALQEALQEPPPGRDPRLIALFLRFNADINSDGGAGVVSAVANHDLNLLNTVIQNGEPTVQTLAAAMPQAMAIGDLPLRRQMVRSLLVGGVGQEGRAAGEALVATLTATPVDGELLYLLLNVGLADVNYKTSAGSAISIAVANPDLRVLDTLLKTQRASPETLTHALYALSSLPSTDAKANKLNMLLRYTQDKTALSDMLISEVESVVKTPPMRRSLSVTKTLLAAGADINVQNAAALCHAVTASDVHIVEMLLERQPSQDSLAAAMSHIFSISDAMDRLSLAKVLLDAGVPAYQASRELKYAVVNTPNDFPLVKMLANFSDPEDSGGLVAAVQQEGTDSVTILLASKRFAVPVLNAALVEAMRRADRDDRQTICHMLVKAGATGTAVSDALLSAAQDADLGLCHVLLANGAKIGHQEGQAVVLACRSGAADMVEMLLRNLPSTPEKDQVLVRAFHEAGLLENLATRAAMFRLLLEKGARGDAVDKQLVVATSYGEDGIPIVRLLLAYGADPNHKDGEAVWTSTRNSFLPILRLLLGLDEHGVSTGGRSSTPTTIVESPKPSQGTMVRALKASWMLSGEDRYQVFQWLFEAGLQANEAVHVALNKAVRDSKPNVNLVRLLLQHGASPVASGCQTLIDAAWRCMVPILELCLAQKISQEDLDYVFAQTFTPNEAARWMTDDGISVARLLLEKGSRGDGLSKALVAAIYSSGGDNDASVRRLIELLVKHGVDVNFDRGQALRVAARRGNLEVVQQLLTLKPEPEAVSVAFQYIFESEPAEDVAIRLVTLFNDYRMEGDASGLDIAFNQAGVEPVVFRALLRYPRSVGILDALLNAGYYHDQMTTARVVPEMEDEPVSLLLWALLQPQKKISSSVLELLIQRGSNVNFETRESKMTPLLIAIQNKRPDLVRALIAAGAQVDSIDYSGNAPLFIAVHSGGDAGLAIMEAVLEAEPCRNDGSLHMAARLLNTDAMKLLVKHGHEVDFPSDLHDGRSALAEICLHGSDGCVLNPASLRDMEHAMTYLIEQGSDIALRSGGKTPLLLALEAEDPVGTTQALLKAGMHKHVNEMFNRYDDGTCTYSPTMYVEHVLYGQSVSGIAIAQRDRLLGLLRRSRTEDVYYAYNAGGKPQPKGAVGVPEDLQRVERERQEREACAAALAHEHELARQRALELAELAEKAHRDSVARERAVILERARAQAEATRMRELAEAEARAEAVRVITRAETQAKAEALQAMILHKEAEQVADLERTRVEHERMMALEGDQKRQMIMYEKQLNEERVSTARQLSSITLEERQALDRLHEAQNRRERARLEEGRRLAEAIREIPGASNALGNRNVTGYILGEET